MQRFDRRAFLKRSGFVGFGLFATPLVRADEIPTPPQTQGPFFPARRREDEDLDLTRVEGRPERARGEVVVVDLVVLDRIGAPVEGAVLDVWQACWSGRYDHPRDPNPAALDPNFQYWARASTGAGGRIRMRTIVPGAYPAADEWMRPPHVHVRVDAWGKRRLTTQMYFEGQPLNDDDHILRATAREHGKAAADSLVVDFGRDRTEDGVPRGTFRIVLGVTPEAD